MQHFVAVRAKQSTDDALSEASPKNNSVILLIHGFFNKKSTNPLNTETCMHRQECTKRLSAGCNSPFAGGSQAAFVCARLAIVQLLLDILTIGLR